MLADYFSFSTVTAVFTGDWVDGCLEADMLLLRLLRFFHNYHTQVSDCSQTQGDREGEESVEFVECSSRKRYASLSVQDMYLKLQWGIALPEVTSTVMSVFPQRQPESLNKCAQPIIY